MSITSFRLRTLFAAMMVLIVGVGIGTFIVGHRIIAANHGIIQEQDIIEELQLTLTTMVDAETGQRGFLLMGDDQYLDPYNAAISRINQHMSRLGQFADSGLIDRPVYNSLKADVDAKLKELAETIDLRRQGNAEEALARVRHGLGKRKMGAIRTDIADEITHHSQIEQRLRTRTDHLTVFRSATFLVCGGLELAFSLWCYSRISQEMRRRNFAAAEIQRQRDLLGVTLGSIGDAVIVTDSNAAITFMNPIAETLTGWTQPEAAGKPLDQIFRIINEHTREAVESPVAKVLRSGSIVGLANHTLLIDKSGREIPIDDSGAPIRDKSGNVYGVVLIFRDFSDYKNVEKTLIQAKADAEAANKAKDQFLATLSHELRTPLSPVVAILNLWEVSEDVPTAMKPDVQMMRRNVDLEARLIDDLLDITKIAQGKLSLNIETADMHDLFTSVSRIVGADIVAKNLRLVVDLKASRHHVRGDTARLQQIMWNVLKNAIKFTDPGGRITIQTTNTPDGGLQMVVCDTGIGISSDTLLRIFRPFEQGSEATARQYGGLGLGLTISRALVEAQGGTITASSDGAGTGAAFIVTLPAVDAPAPPLYKPVIAPTLPAAGTPVRILLVEDHVDTARAMNRLLVGLGYQVQVAHTVKSALALADSHPFDLLLSDLGLPDGTGLELLKELRGKSPLPAVALTGFGMEDDIIRCREAGFSAHLTKPINFNTLHATIREVTENGAANPAIKPSAKQ